MYKPVTTAPITFTTTPCAGDGLLGYASIDIADDEAADMLRELRDRHGIDIDINTASGPASFLNDASATRADGLLAVIEGRHLVGISDLRGQIADDVSRLLFDPMRRTRERSEHHDHGRRYFATNLAETTESRVDAFDAWLRACERFLTTLDAEDVRPLYEGGHLKEWDFEQAWASIAENRGAIVDHVSAWRPADGLLGGAGGAVTLEALHAHATAWGRRHRLVSIAVTEGAFAIAGRIGPTSRLARGQHEGFQCRMPNDGHWRAWRLSGPVRIVPPAAGPAARLAKMIATIGVSHARRRLGQTAWPCAERLERHYYGPYLFTAEAREDSQEDYADLFSARRERDGIRKLLIDTDTHPNEFLRLADGIAGPSLRERRDRLLLRMLGSGSTPERLCGLTLPHLRLDGLDDLYEACGAEGRQRSFLRGLDTGDGDDFWSLVHASASLGGLLFAAVREGRAYGRDPLTCSDVARIVATRRAECAARKPAPAAELTRSSY